MYFFMLNGKTLSTVLNNKLSNTKNYVDIINLYFLILNKKTLYFERKKQQNVILILSNKIINYGFEIFNLRDLGMIFRDLEILDSSWGY